MSQSLLTLRAPQNTYEFVVSSFEYHAALSNLYSLELKCRLNDLPDGLRQDLQQHPPVSFVYGSADQTRDYKIHGVIMASEIIYDQAKKCYFLSATIRPKVALLADSLVVQLFPNQSIQAIVTAFLETAAQYLGPINYQIQISDPLLVKPLPGLEIQYGESDFDYLQHLCRYGLFFYFVQGDNQETLVITDQLESTPVHPETIQLDPHLRIAPHIDNPIFNWKSTETHALAYQVKARFYDPQRPEQSVQQLTANIDGTSYTMEGLIFDLDDQATLNQKLTGSINAQQFTTELRGNYSALDVGQRIRFEDQRQLIYSLTLDGKFSQGRWNYQTILRIMPEGKVYYGISPHYTKKELPGNLYAAALQANEQVNPNGYFRAQVTKSLIEQNEVNPDVLLRDIQGTSTQAGGSSHSTTYEGEVLLTTHNGQSADIMIAGGLANAKYPANVTTQNEQDTSLKNQGGLEIRLRRQRDNQPHAHIHMGVTDDSQAQSFMRIGGHKEPGEDPKYGMQEGSTGFAKKVTSKNALKQVGQDIQNPVYKFQHQQTDDSKHDIKEQINTDSYSQRYYTTPLSGDTTPVVGEPDAANITDALQAKTALVHGLPNVKLTLPPKKFFLKPVIGHLINFERQLEISGSFAATSKQSLTHVEFEGRKASLIAEAKQVTGDCFDGSWSVALNPDTKTIALNSTLTGPLGSITCTVLKANEFQATYAGLPIKKIQPNGWNIEGTCNITVTVTMNPNPPKTAVPGLPLVEIIRQHLIEIGASVTPFPVIAELIGQKLAEAHASEVDNISTQDDTIGAEVAGGLLFATAVLLSPIGA